MNYPLLFVIIYTLYLIYRLTLLSYLIRRTTKFDYPTVKGHVDVRLFGDSMASGVGAKSIHTTIYGRLQSASPSKRFDCRAKTGQYMSGLIKQLDNNSYKQHTALVYTGGMDILYRMPITYSRNLEKVIERLLKTSTKIILFSPANAGKIRFFPWPARLALRRRSAILHSLMAKMAQANNKIELIDLYSRSTNIKKLPKYYFASDMIHPSESSFKILADKVRLD